MSRWSESIGLAVTVHAVLLLLPFEPQGSLGEPVRGDDRAVRITLIEAVEEQAPEILPRDPRSDERAPGLETPTVQVAATDRPMIDTPALARDDPHTSVPEPEPEPVLDATSETRAFVRADPDAELVPPPESTVISDRNLAATQLIRREIETPRIGPPTDGDLKATDVPGSATNPDTVSMPRVELKDNDVPLQVNREDPSRPGARSGGDTEVSRAEAPQDPEVGAPGGQDEQRIASKGDAAVDADGAREPGEAGDDAPTRDGLAFASEGDFPVPSTGGADPGDPKPEGPDLPSRSVEGVRPLLSPGILDWIQPEQSADGGQPRSELGHQDRSTPRVGELVEGEGQTHSGDGTGIAQANPGERERQEGSRAAAGGTGSAMLDSAMVLEEDLPLDVELAINAIETPLGRYAAGIDQLMRDAWKPPLEAQLMSGYGVTTVTFRVDARGRVTDKEITRMSGISGLDIAALVAVPDKVPRPDRELLAPGEHLHVTYTFRHSSPIVSRSAQH